MLILTCVPFHKRGLGVNYSVTQSMAGTQTPINDFLDQNGTLAPLKKLEPKKKKTNTREVG